MARAKKDYKALNIKIESTIYERFETTLKKRGKQKQRLLNVF